MKDLLYLKDDQIKDCIQLLLYAYRETFTDPGEVLKKKSLGPAHFRALNLIESNEGISVSELIYKLKICLIFYRINLDEISKLHFL